MGLGACFGPPLRSGVFSPHPGGPVGGGVGGEVPDGGVVWCGERTVLYARVEVWKGWCAV
ncbi:predicted protein [Plenodomus lingam JN3]|uniref:Predicted protein n=1 Tax=Leptosphaeria maculans (strain JN3 / isolate v23.1.3 / race Av1-4-5-6-7-8) TaxID=985895 RepID=E4ZIU2_LEPMJ|nr:predicted protein [Plenodomus lingam JN3]CBX91113.1 predicted protein [Plenodomus lingam JN3]